MERAALHYERGSFYQSTHANALLNLGTALQQQNKLGQARSRYNQSLAIQPDLAAAHRQLANIKRFKSKDSQFKTMRNLQRVGTLQREICVISILH